MLRASLAAAVVGVGALAFTLPALAQGAGLDGLHDKRREGGRICLSDHFHDGSGSGSSRRQAEGAAARAWSEFTAWEYGAEWGSFSNAASKSMNCSDSGGSWQCQASARACKSGGERVRRRSRD